MSDEPKDTDWRTIIERAAKHPVGVISMAHPATLRAMERKGLIYKSTADDWLLNDEAYEWLKEQQAADSNEAPGEEATVGMDAEMREAFERAVHTSTGYFHGVPEAVLKRLTEAGIAYRETDEEAYQLTEKGWELATLPDPVSPDGIRYRVADAARWEIPVELFDPVPDTASYGTAMVRPRSVTIGLTRNLAGVWCVSSVAVWGPKVKDGKVTTTRDYSVLFSDLLNDVTGAPQWLRGICQDWVDRANGWASLAAEPKKSGLTLEERVARLEKLAGVRD